jgi:methyl-accepting chemotaxis protein
MADALQQRLDFVGLGEGVEARLSPIADSAARHLDLALQRLAMQVAGAPSAARFLFGRERIEADNGGPAAHWRALVAGQFDRGFVEAATRAGQRQARIGVDPRWHAGSHAIVLQSLIRGVIRDSIEAALPGRRRSLALLGGVDPAAVLSASEIMAEGLAALVSAVVIDLDLTFSGYVERLRLDAEAALVAEKNRVRQMVSAAGQVLEQAARGRVAVDAAALSDPELAPLKVGAECLADRMVELVGDLDVSGRAVRTLATEVLRCARLLRGLDADTAGAAAPLGEALSSLLPAAKAAAGGADEILRKSRSGARRAGKVKNELASARDCLAAAGQNGIAEAIERADALGLVVSLMASRLTKAGDGQAGDPALERDMGALATGLAQLAAQLRVGQDKAQVARDAAGAALDTALAHVQQLAAEQGETVRVLSGLDRSLGQVTSLADDASIGCADLDASLAAGIGQKEAIAETLNAALEGAAALLDLAQAMGSGMPAAESSPAIPAPENAVLAAHWHVL